MSSNNDRARGVRSLSISMKVSLFASRPGYHCCCVID
jgi:hypothetical protein